MFEQFMLMNEPGAGYKKQDTGKWQGINFLKDLYQNRPWIEQVDAANKLRMERLKPQPKSVSTDQNAWVLMSQQNPEIQRSPAQASPSGQLPAASPTAVKQSMSVSGSGMPQSPDEMKALLEENAAFVGQHMQGQNELAKAYAGQGVQTDLSPLMSYIDSWNGRNTLTSGYNKPKSQEEKMAVIEQLKNGILKAQQGLTADEMEALKFGAQQKLAWANLGLEKEKLGLLKKQAGMKAPTGEQFKAATFGQRAADADVQLESLISGGYDPTSGTAATQRSLPTALICENAKLADQAERNFINALLRRESGAAISKSEFSSAEKQYFPRYGDTPEVLAQKAANRQRSIEGMRLESGNAWGQFNQNRFTPNTNSKDPSQMTREEMIQFLQGG